MNAKNNNKIIKTLIAVALLAMGQQTAIAADNDSIPAKKKAKPKMECCEDTTVTDHKDPYHKVVKEGGSMCEGMFTVRHIKDDWYMEVPDSMVGRMMLAVTRFASVPSSDECAQVRTHYQLPERYVLSVGTIEQRKKFLTTLLNQCKLLYTNPFTRND